MRAALQRGLRVRQRRGGEPSQRAAPVASAPCRKLRREPSAGAGVSVAVFDLLDSGACESMRFLSQMGSDFVECEATQVEHRPPHTSQDGYQPSLTAFCFGMTGKSMT